MQDGELRISRVARVINSVRVWWWFCGWFALFLILAHVSSVAEDILANAASKNILVVDSAHLGDSFDDNDLDQLIAELKKFNHNIEITIITLDSKRITSEGYRLERLNMLLSQYPCGYFDLIISKGNSALHTIYELGAAPLGNSPVIIYDANNFDKLKYANLSGIESKPLIRDNLELALSLFPELEYVAVITDNSEQGAATRRIIKEEMRKYTRLSAIYLNEDRVSDSEFLGRIESLPNNCCVFIDSWGIGAVGQEQKLKLLGKVLSEYSIPVFTNKQAFIKLGALGGVIPDVAEIYRIISNYIAPDILSGKLQASDISISILNSNSTVINWKVMQHFAADYAVLGANVKFCCKPETLAQGKLFGARKLRVLYTEESPWVRRTAEGKLAGALIDIWRVIAHNSGIDIEFQVLDSYDKGSVEEEAFYPVVGGRSEVITTERQMYGADKISPFLVTTASIYASRDDLPQYEWRGYSNKRVALVKNCSFRDFLTQMIPGVTLVIYKNRQGLLESLDSGDFDAFFMEDMVAAQMLSGLSTTQRFKKNRFCETKIKLAPALFSNAELDKQQVAEIEFLNAEINKLGFENLYNVFAYYNKFQSRIYPIFTPEELTWIRKHKKLIIGCAGNYGLLQNWNNNGVVEGLLPEILRSILLSIELTPEFVEVPPGSSEQELVQTYGVEALSFSMGRESGVSKSTLPYLKIPVMAVSRESTDYPGDGKSNIGVPAGYGSLYRYLQLKYKYSQIILVDTPQQALQQVQAGSLDIAFISELNGESYRINPKYAKLVYNLQYDCFLHFSLGILSAEDSAISSSIINKCILVMPRADISALLEKYYVEQSSPLPFGKVLVMVGPWALGILTILLALWVYTTRKAYLKLHISEKNLLEERAWLKATMHSIGDGVIATDISGRIVQLNLAAEELLQCSEKNALGHQTQDIFKLINATKMQEIENPVITSLNEKKTVDIQHNLLLVEQRQNQIPVTAITTPILNTSTAEILGAVIVLKDISSEAAYRKQLTQTKTILGNVIKLAGVSYFVYNLKTKKVVIGGGRKETHLFIDKNFNLHDIIVDIVEEDFAELNELWERLLERQVNYFRVSYKSSDNGVIRYNRVDISAELNAQNELTSVLGVRIDVTDIVQAENVARERLEQAYDLAKLLYYEYQPKTGEMICDKLSAELFMLDVFRSGFITIQELMVNVVKEDRERLEAYQEQVRSEQLAKFAIELRIEKAGEAKIVEVFANNKFSEAGEWIGSTGCILDITELNYVQKELKASEEQKKLILSSIQEAVVYINKNLEIIWANESTYKIFDCSELVPLSKEYNYIVYGSAKPDVTSNTVEVIQGLSEEFTESLSYNGKELYVSLNPIRNEQQQVTSLVKTFADVSEFRDIQLSLKEAYERAEMASKAKSTFLSTITHEIRTPLNAIIGFSGLLQYEKLDAKSASSAGSIHTAATGLLSLINNVLDFSRMEADKLTLSLAPLNLSELLEEMRAIFEVKARMKNLTLDIKEYSSNLALILDKVRVRQVLINVIGNAVKFTSTGSIEVSTAYKQYSTKTSGELRIAVKDSGIGIPKQAQSRVFESFEQHESSSTRRYEGTGLGLSISKRLVELMDGEIRLKSAVGEGSEFIIVLNNVEYTTMHRDEKASSTVGSINIFDKQSVLLVSNNQNDLTIIASMLTTMGLRVETTSFVGDALELLVEEDFSLVLTSVLLVEERDMLLYGKMLESVRKKNIAIIALTGYSEPDEHFDTSLYNAVIIKPITLEAFSEVIGKFIVARASFTDNTETVSIVRESRVEDLAASVRKKVLEEFGSVFAAMSHGIVIDDAQRVAQRLLEFAEEEEDETLINIANRLQRNVATFKLPDIMYIVKQFLKDEV